MFSASGVREKHQDWEALLEKALAEECSAPANLLELVRQKNGAAALSETPHTLGGAGLYLPRIITSTKCWFY